MRSRPLPATPCPGCGWLILDICTNGDCPLPKPDLWAGAEVWARREPNVAPGPWGIEASGWHVVCVRDREEPAA